MENAKPASRSSGPPMTLGNMRANGVRRLLVSCGECHHSGVIDVDGYGDEVPVPIFFPAS
jgi:flagellar motor protein MotB